MYRILFKLGAIEILTWWVMLFSSFLVAGIFACRYIASLRKRLGDEVYRDIPTTGQTAMLFLLFCIWGIVGARLAYVIWHIDRYRVNPLEIPQIFRGGFISYGGIALATLAGIWYLKSQNLSILKSSDLIFVYVPLMDIIRRLGCFFNGCCFGRPTNSWIGVALPKCLIAYHPTPLYFVASSIIIFFVLRALRKRPHREGAIFYSYFLLYFFGRFFIEFSRKEYAMRSGPLTIAQVICIGGFLLFLVLLIRKKEPFRT